MLHTKLWSSSNWNKHMHNNLFPREMLSTDETLPAILLITGPNGAGKSAGKTTLVKHTLKERVQAQHGYFLVCKFDPLQKPEPIVAFSPPKPNLQVVERGPKAISEMRRSIVDAVREECCVLVSMIPAFYLILVVCRTLADQKVRKHATTLHFRLRVVCECCNFYGRTSCSAN